MDGAHAYTKVAPTLKGQDGQGWGDELTEGGWEVEARARKLTPATFGVYLPFYLRCTRQFHSRKMNLGWVTVFGMGMCADGDAHAVWAPHTTAARAGHVREKREQPNS